VEKDMAPNKIEKSDMDPAMVPVTRVYALRMVQAMVLVQNPVIVMAPVPKETEELDLVNKEK
jgi:hypothetical protein